MTWVIVASGGAVAWGKNHDPPQGQFAVWEDVDLDEDEDDDE